MMSAVAACSRWRHGGSDCLSGTYDQAEGKLRLDSELFSASTADGSAMAAEARHRDEPEVVQKRSRTVRIIGRGIPPAARGRAG